MDVRITHIVTDGSETTVISAGGRVWVRGVYTVNEDDQCDD